MRKWLLALCAVFLFSFSAFAQVGDKADLSGLSEQKRAEIQKIVADTKASEASGRKIPDVSTPQKLGEWVGVGTQIAELIPIFAEKTGIAADKVLNSTAGQILLTIVLVKFFWAKIMGILFFTVGFYVWWRMFNRVFLVKNIKKVPHANGTLANWGFHQSQFEYNTWAEVRSVYETDVFPWIFAVAGILNILFGIIGIMHWYSINPTFK
jgi:hypothetical protein